MSGGSDTQVTICCELGVSLAAEKPPGGQDKKGSFEPGCGLHSGFPGDDRRLAIPGCKARGQVDVHEPRLPGMVCHGRAQAHMIGEQGTVLAERAFSSASCGQSVWTMVPSWQPLPLSSKESGFSRPGS